jgi:hypothetical protein
MAIKIDINIILLSYSRSYIQPDDGYICIAETCSCLTYMIKAVY